MAIFAVQYTYLDDADLVQEHRPEHREFLTKQHEEGRVLLSGPKVSEPAGALIIVRADSAAEVAELMDADPFNAYGIITERSITEWNVVIGEL